MEVLQSSARSCKHATIHDTRIVLDKVEAYYMINASVIIYDHMQVVCFKCFTAGDQIHLLRPSKFYSSANFPYFNLVTHIETQQV